VAAEVDVTKTASNRLLTGLGARPTGGFVELVRRRPAGGQSPGWAQESSYAAATRLGTTMRHASTTSSRISAWSIASSHTRTQL
jgi:hypothetical protein